MKKIPKILLAAMVAAPLLALADDNPCAQSINSVEAAACNDIYSSLRAAKENFIEQYHYTLPNMPALPPSKTSASVFNFPPPNSPGPISTTSTPPLTAPIANPATSNRTTPNIYR